MSSEVIMTAQYDHRTSPLSADLACGAAAATRPVLRSGSRYAPCKAAADRALALALLALTGPLILLLMALVKLTSRGPALYTQVRLGLGGRPYTIYKIRTMHHDCERHSGPRWSTAGDPRVTPPGRWLRRSHLDELPQLWNVVRGEMSLVGPRPERPEFVAQLERAIPGYRTRLAVRPGITGLAQVQLPADEDYAGVRRKVACDAVYVTRMGPWLDLRILLATVLKVSGVPFEVTRRALRLPGVTPESAARGVPASDPSEAVAPSQAARWRPPSSASSWAASGSSGPGTSSPGTPTTWPATSTPTAAPG